MPQAQEPSSAATEKAFAENCESEDEVEKIGESKSAYSRRYWLGERYGLGEASAPPTTGSVVMCPEIRCFAALPSNDFRDRRDELCALRRVLAKESPVEWMRIARRNAQLFHLWMRWIDQIVAAFRNKDTWHF